MTTPEPAAASGYSFDTNVVIDGRVRRYPPDVFPSVWQNIEGLVAARRVVIAEEVRFELERGDDDCHQWASSRQGLVVAADDGVIALVARITADYPDWVSEQANWADPFVIAHAWHRGWTVVTEERLSRSPIQARTKIPNVCQDYDVPCLTFVELARRENWIF